MEHLLNNVDKGHYYTNNDFLYRQNTSTIIDIELAFGWGNKGAICFITFICEELWNDSLRKYAEKLLLTYKRVDEI